MSFSLVYGFVRDPLAVLIVLSVQALIHFYFKVGIAAAWRPASGRSLRTTSGRGFILKNSKWEELMR